MPEETYLSSKRLEQNEHMGCIGNTIYLFLNDHEAELLKKFSEYDVHNMKILNVSFLLF